MVWKSRRMRVLLAVGVVSLAGLGAAAALMLPQDALSQAKPADAQPAQAERPPQPVRVTRVTPSEATAEARYTGTIRPAQEVALAFRIAGKIVARGVEVGDPVTRGQVLARLDDTDARLERQLAEAEERAARIDASRAAAELERAKTLFAQGHAAQAVLDRATSGAAEAASRAERAAQALQLASNRLDYTRIVAEADGIVTATQAEDGQVVAAGQPVLSVARGGAVDVVFALPEQDRAQLEQAVAQAELWGAEGTSYTLALRDIAPDVEPAGRTYRVRMSILAPDDAADLGRTVTVRLALGAEAPAIALPLAAVLNDGAGPVVWRLTQAGDRVEAVPVEVVSVSGQVVRLRGPLGAGDLVVSLGAQKIDPTRPVRVVETAAPPEG